MFIMDKKQKIYIAAIAVLAVALVAVTVGLCIKNSTLNSFLEQMEYDKAQLQEEFEDLTAEYAEYQTDMTIHNDSLVSLLTQEQQRVKDLLEELRMTKATDAKKIAELKKELASVRATLAIYAQKIDSLSAANEILLVENSSLMTANSNLMDENSSLSGVVQRASVLDVTSCVAQRQTKKGKNTNLTSMTRNVELTYHIAKNLAAEEGDRVMNISITNANGEQMVELVHPFYFSGNAQDLTDTWTMEKAPASGEYNVVFSIDGVMIGAYTFKL